jgi:hypothetical protein
VCTVLGYTCVRARVYGCVCARTIVPRKGRMGRMARMGHAFPTCCTAVWVPSSTEAAPLVKTCRYIRNSRPAPASAAAGSTMAGDPLAELAAALSVAWLTLARRCCLTAALWIGVGLAAGEVVEASGAASLLPLPRNPSDDDANTAIPRIL